MTVGAGVEVETTEYRPYGSVRSQNGEVSGYNFTDQELDSGTELYNYDARFYDPNIGLFISADSIVPDYTNPQSLNRYMYTLGNPLKYTDPSGHTEDDTADNGQGMSSDDPNGNDMSIGDPDGPTDDNNDVTGPNGVESDESVSSNSDSKGAGNKGKTAHGNQEVLSKEMKEKEEKAKKALSIAKTFRDVLYGKSFMRSFVEAMEEKYQEQEIQDMFTDEEKRDLENLFLFDKIELPNPPPQHRPQIPGKYEHSRERAK